MRQAVLSLPCHHGVVRTFHVKWILEVVVNLNRNSWLIQLRLGRFLESFFSVTALCEFVLKKIFRYADVLASGDHRASLK